MSSRVWLLACAALVGACGSHGEFPFDRDAGSSPRPDARVVVDARPAPDAGTVTGELPAPTPATTGEVTCAEGGRYTVCGGVTEAPATTLSSGESVRGSVGGSHLIEGTRFGIQGGLHVVR